MRIDDATATGHDIRSLQSAANWSLPEIGQCLAGRFLLRSVLGSGGTGTVFAALDSSVGEKVAIKVLRPDMRDVRNRERLRREVRASRPGHENVVSIYDLHEVKPHLFLSMELVEGRSLKEVMRGEEPQLVEKVIAVGRQVARALEHLHGKGLVHRDVKPGNILVGDDAVVKLCDMGLARPLEAGVTVTETEMVVGTPDYMAPEQASGAELTAASDVYGLGLTLYQMMTGEVALKESTAMATISRRLRERPASIRKVRQDCPRWLDRLVRRMLEPDPRERISPAAAIRAFEKQRLMPKPRRQTLAIILLGASALTVATVGGRAVMERPTVRVEVGEMSIAGFDRDGEQTWTRSFDLPVSSTFGADLDGDGLEETVVVLAENDKSLSRELSPNGPEIRIIRRQDGVVVSRFLPEEHVKWPFGYAVDLDATPLVMDVNHDNRPEIVLTCFHHSFFPAVLFVYWADDGQWGRVFTNSGYFLDIWPDPPQVGAGLRFLAVNNRLGMMVFLGDIRVADAGKSSLSDMKTGSLNSALLSPPFGSSGESPYFRLDSYVPLPAVSSGLFRGDTEIRDLSDGGIELLPADGSVLVFDRYLNPVGGVNEGSDLRELRRDFMDGLQLLTAPNQLTNPEWVRQRRTEMVDRFRLLLREAPYRVILDLTTSCALARAGDIGQARAILLETARTARNSDVIYRLAHFEALSGSFQAAAERLDELSMGSFSDASNSRATFDGPHLGVRIGIETRDRAAVDRWATALSMRDGNLNGFRVGASLRARAHLWWDELLPEDLAMETFSYDSSAGAIEVLARWRQGVSRPQDIDAMASFIERNPDARYEGELARAATLLGVGRTSESLDALATLTTLLEMPAGEDFGLKQIRDLCRAIWVVALAADGQVERARSEGSMLRRRLTPDLLPAILVDEVLAGSGEQRLR